MYLLLTSYTLIMLLKVLSHFIMRIKNFMKYFKNTVFKYFKIFMKFFNIWRWNISSCIPRYNFDLPPFAYLGGHETEHCTLAQFSLLHIWVWHLNAYVNQTELLYCGLCDYCGETETAKDCNLITVYYINVVFFADRSINDPLIINDQRLIKLSLVNINVRM